MDTTSCPFLVLRVCPLRCLIYKVHAPVLLGWSFSVSHQPLPVKGSLLDCPRSPRQLVYYTTPLPLCQALFPTFYGFFGRWGFLAFFLKNCATLPTGHADFSLTSWHTELDIAGGAFKDFILFSLLHPSLPDFSPVMKGTQNIFKLFVFQLASFQVAGEIPIDANTLQQEEKIKQQSSCRGDCYKSGDDPNGDP